MNEQDIFSFRELLTKDRVMIVVHRNPDGDALGTAFALQHVFERLNRRVCIAAHDSVSRLLRFLADGREELKPQFEPECIVSVDVATEELFGTSLAIYANRTDYNIDHHYTNTRYARCNIVCSDRSSAGEVLYELLLAAGVEIDCYIAAKLYAAISFDTGCFRFSNVGIRTHRIAGELLSFGIDAADINRRLFDIATLEQLKIENLALTGVRQYKDKHVTVLVITRDMLEQVGASDEDIHGLTDLTRRIDGTVVGVTMRETQDGMFKVSLRSSDQYFNVSRVAAVFGGGGHVRASGCILPGPVDVARDRLLEAIDAEWKLTYRVDHVFDD